jgi:hypothetical protein
VDEWLFAKGITPAMKNKKLAWVRQIHLDTVNQDYPLLKSGDQ